MPPIVRPLDYTPYTVPEGVPLEDTSAPQGAVSIGAGEVSYTDPDRGIVEPQAIPGSEWEVSDEGMTAGPAFAEADEEELAALARQRNIDAVMRMLMEEQMRRELARRADRLIGERAPPWGAPHWRP
jgi:hypothetical protein